MLSVDIEPGQLHPQILGLFKTPAPFQKQFRKGSSSPNRSRSSERRKHFAAGFLAGFLGIPRDLKKAAGFLGQDSIRIAGFLCDRPKALYNVLKIGIKRAPPSTAMWRELNQNFVEIRKRAGLQL